MVPARVGVNGPVKKRLILASESSAPLAKCNVRGTCMRGQEGVDSQQALLSSAKPRSPCWTRPSLLMELECQICTNESNEDEKSISWLPGPEVNDRAHSRRVAFLVDHVWCSWSTRKSQKLLSERRREERRGAREFRGLMFTHGDGLREGYQ